MTEHNCMIIFAHTILTLDMQALLIADPCLGLDPRRDGPTSPDWMDADGREPCNIGSQSKYLYMGCHRMLDPHAHQGLPAWMLVLATWVRALTLYVFRDRPYKSSGSNVPLKAEPEIEHLACPLKKEARSQGVASQHHVKLYP